MFIICIYVNPARSCAMFTIHCSVSAKGFNEISILSPPCLWTSLITDPEKCLFLAVISAIACCYYTVKCGWRKPLCNLPSGSIWVGLCLWTAIVSVFGVALFPLIPVSSQASVFPSVSLNPRPVWLSSHLCCYIGRLEVTKALVT